MTHLTFFFTMSAARRAELPHSPPLVSILKPVAGRDDGLALNLATFEALDYPAYALSLVGASLVLSWAGARLSLAGDTGPNGGRDSASLPRRRTIKPCRPHSPTSW